MATVWRERNPQALYLPCTINVQVDAEKERRCSNIPYMHLEVMAYSHPSALRVESGLMAVAAVANPECLPCAEQDGMPGELSSFANPPDRPCASGRVHGLRVRVRHGHPPAVRREEEARAAGPVFPAVLGGAVVPLRPVPESVIPILPVGRGIVRRECSRSSYEDDAGRRPGPDDQGRVACDRAHATALLHIPHVGGGFIADDEQPRAVGGKDHV